MWNADLRGADLEGADLRNADLTGADLIDANLEGADLRWTTLPDDVSGAIFKRAQTGPLNTVRLLGKL